MREPRLELVINLNLCFDEQVLAIFAM